MGFFWLCVALGIVCFIGGFFNWLAFLGVPIVLAGIPYLMAAVWMDKHSAWDQRSKESIWKL